jgi:hypothetical protein
LQSNPLIKSLVGFFASEASKLERDSPADYQSQVGFFASEASKLERDSLHGYKEKNK